MEEWIEEFLFRGRPPSGPDSDQTPTWHVVIGQQQDSPFAGREKDRNLAGPMSPEQAEALGWPLSRLLDGINAEAVRSLNELQAQVEAGNVAMAEKDQRITELENAVRDLSAKLAEPTA